VPAPKKPHFCFLDAAANSREEIRMGPDKGYIKAKTACTPPSGGSAKKNRDTARGYLSPRA
jgi:hypothetical protein